MMPDRGDVDGVAFFTDAVLDGPPAGPSVFGILDQTVAESRFSAVAEDDLGSDFFSDHGIQVDAESRQAFRESLVAMGQQEAGHNRGAGPVPAPSRVSPHVGVSLPEGLEGAERPSALTAEQRDFILFGPRS